MSAGWQLSRKEGGREGGRSGREEGRKEERKEILEGLTSTALPRERRGEADS